MLRLHSFRRLRRNVNRKGTVMKKVIVMIVAFVSLAGLEPWAVSGEVGRYVVLPVKNPEYHPNELFRAFDDFHNPRIRKLRTRYGLDEVVAAETDEWKRILLLRHWLWSNIRIDNHHPTQTQLETFAILDAALKGGRFHCTHFSIVQQAVLNSYGYVTRRLGCGPGLKDNGGHHGVNEVWVNKFRKWVLVDAKYDLHFEKDGLPLSALQIRDEIWKDGGKSVVRCFGLKGMPSTNQYPEKFGPNTTTYRWCSWEVNTNRFTAFPAAFGSVLVMYEDDIFRKNTWYRDGKPHWAYNTPYLITTTRRDWIEWTPNVVSSNVELKGDGATVFLTSFTPNFRSYQVKCGEGPWLDCEDRVELPLSKALNRFTFRVVNLFGVAGPKHGVEIDWKSGL